MRTANPTSRTSWSRRSTQKLIVEIKAANEMADPIVQAKARAACKWVGYANDHARNRRQAVGLCSSAP